MKLAREVFAVVQYGLILPDLCSPIAICSTKELAEAIAQRFRNASVHQLMAKEKIGLSVTIRANDAFARVLLATSASPEDIVEACNLLQEKCLDLYVPPPRGAGPT